LNFPKVTIVILNWNGKKDTLECIESLKKITYPNYEILLVDNGSVDGSVNYFSEHYPDIKIIDNKVNLGFSEGNNVGINWALENNTDYVLLLNNDTIVDPVFLQELINITENDPAIGIACPKIYYANPDNMINYAGGKINWYTGQPKHIGQKITNVGQYDSIAEVDFVSGACMLIKKQVIKKIGRLPTEYFLLWEDIDYSVNARLHGYKLLYIPKSVIWHKTSVSIKKVSTKTFYLSTRNRIIFNKKYSPKVLYMFALFYFVSFYGPMGLLFVLIKSKNPYLLHCYFRGLKDGILYKIVHKLTCNEQFTK
jgi:GT2 family glycosyltransferase